MKNIKVEHIKGNALDYASLPGHVLIHVCNDAGGYGGGPTAMATQIKERFPDAYVAYRGMDWETLGNVSSDCVSTCDGVVVNNKPNIINMIAQHGYGPRQLGPYIRYEALEKCFNEISKLPLLKEHNIHTLVVPYLMGADRAGGCFETIMDMLVFELEEDHNETINRVLVVEFNG